MSTVILLLALFGIKHFICDFVLQYPYMLIEKGIYGAQGGLHHAAFHMIGTALVLLLCEFPIIDILLLSLIDGIMHYHIDWGKQQLNRGLTSADNKFWIILGADQALHYLTYVFIIGLIIS
jgi:hypothetical protein